MQNRNKVDTLLSYAAFFQFVVLMLHQIIIGTNLLPAEQSRLLNIVLSAIPIIISIYFILKRHLKLVITVYLLITILILYSAVLFPVNIPYIKKEAFYLIGINAACFLSISSIRDIDMLKNSLLRISYLIFSLGLLYFILILVGKVPFTDYSMSFSYYLLLPALVFISNRKIINYFLFMIVCLMMFVIGSRGAIVSVALFVSLITLKPIKRNITLLIFLSIVVLFSLIVDFNAPLKQISESVGISSRSLKLISEGNFMNTSGRGNIYSVTLNSIINSPFFGYGIFSDRVLLGGKYAHNIFLEIFHNFGIFTGIFIVILITFKSIYFYRKLQAEHKVVFWVIFFFCLFPLLVSGSYLTNSWFGIFLGLLFQNYNNRSSLSLKNNIK